MKVILQVLFLPLALIVPVIMMLVVLLTVVIKSIYGVDMIEKLSINKYGECENHGKENKLYTHHKIKFNGTNRKEFTSKENILFVCDECHRKLHEEEKDRKDEKRI
jgi:hypothetical protein